MCIGSGAARQLAPPCGRRGETRNFIQALRLKPDYPKLNPDLQIQLSRRRSHSIHAADSRNASLACSSSWVAALESATCLINNLSTHPRHQIGAFKAHACGGHMWPFVVVTNWQWLDARNVAQSIVAAPNSGLIRRRARCR
eukprot:366476-Chlamydomonas_euryale.AAC.9